MQKLFRFFGMLSKSKGINRSGMGLGLTISKMLIRELGGEINVVSVPNEGSKFTLTIPLEKLPEPVDNPELESPQLLNTINFTDPGSVDLE